MKTTDSVIREIKDICTYHGDEGTSGYCLSNEQFGKLEALYSHSLAEARREWVEEMRGKVNDMKYRGIAHSDLEARRHNALLEKIEDLLTGDNPEEGKV